MKIKTSKMSTRKPVKKSVPAGETRPIPMVPASQSQMGVSHGRPSPDELFAEAMEEPDYYDLRKYRMAIQTLRVMGFSFRQIASWLSNHDVPADHNAVYRVYTADMHPGEVELVDQEDAERDEIGG